MNKEPSLEARAVIAAAVYVTLGANARIAAVEPARPATAIRSEPPMAAWSLEGRREIHGGHRVR